MPDQPATRRTADERRVDVLDAALIEFATYGLHGASTMAIAERAGISQPYVLRLFSTKKQLFLETVAMAQGMIETTWRRALAEAPVDLTPQQRLMVLGEAFLGLTGHTDALRLLLQAFGASADDDVRAQCQGAMGTLFDWVRANSEASLPEVQAFFAQGMMIMVAVSIGAADVADEPWARAFTGQLD